MATLERAKLCERWLPSKTLLRGAIQYAASILNSSTIHKLHVFPNYLFKLFYFNELTRKPTPPAADITKTYRRVCVFALEAA